MIIDIDRLPEEGLRLSRDFEFLSLDLVEENAVFLEPAHAEVTVRLVGEEILVRGEITARLSFVCSRCLTPFEFPVASRFDLVYLPEELDGFSDELSDDKMDQMFYSGPPARPARRRPRAAEPDLPGQAPVRAGTARASAPSAAGSSAGAIAPAWSRRPTPSGTSSKSR